MRDMKQRRPASKARPTAALPAALQRTLDAALAQHRRGELEPAMEGYRAVLAAAPKDVDALLNLGAALTTLGKPREAVTFLRRARSAARTLPRAQNDVGVCFAELGRYDEAAEALRAAVALAPEYGEAWKNLGFVLNEAGREDEALPVLQQAVFVEPLQAQGWFELHKTLFDAENARPAVEALSRAVASDPHYGWARFCLGVMLDLAGDRRAAAQMHAALVKDAAKFTDAVDGWKYIQAHRTPRTRLFATTCRTLRFALEQAALDGAVLELGVRYGVSTRWIAEGSGGRTVHGFDSFQGLPEAWLALPVGAYSTHGDAPDLPANVELHVGLFEDTVAPFARDQKGPIRFANIDCDLYSSTVTVLDALADHVAPGTVLVFDEYVVNQGWREDEYKAFQEAVKARGWTYEYAAFSPLTGQAVVKILG